MAEVIFKCRSKTEYDDGLADVNMEPIQGEENNKFFKNGPNGYFNLHGIAPDIATQFKSGKLYKIEITETEV